MNANLDPNEQTQRMTGADQKRREEEAADNNSPQSLGFQFFEDCAQIILERRACGVNIASRVLGRYRYGQYIPSKAAGLAVRVLQGIPGCQATAKVLPMTNVVNSINDIPHPETWLVIEMVWS